VIGPGVSPAVTPWWTEEWRVSPQVKVVLALVEAIDGRLPADAVAVCQKVPQGDLKPSQGTVRPEGR
jgi:hypothetical protein